MADLSDADAVAEVLTHLQGHAGVLDALGGANHISGVMEGPWPHLVVSPGDGGSLGLLRATIGAPVKLELYGPTDMSVGPAALWKTAMKVLLAVMEMPERDHVAGRAVVSRTDPVGDLAQQNLTNGQVRFTAQVALTISPPN